MDLVLTRCPLAENIDWRFLSSFEAYWKIWQDKEEEPVYHSYSRREDSRKEIEEDSNNDDDETDIPAFLRKRVF